MAPPARPSWKEEGERRTAAFICFISSRLARSRFGKGDAELAIAAVSIAAA
jgi:hypothetical protein